MAGSFCEDAVDDIEDLMKVGDVLSGDLINRRKDVVPKVRRKKVKRLDDEDQCRVEDLRTDSIIPGSLSTYYICDIGEFDTSVVK